MCAPFSDSNAMMGRVRKPYHPSKERRFEEHRENQRQILEDSGFDFNSEKARHPMWGLLNVQDEMKFSERDDEEYISGSGMSAARIDNPQATVPVERQRDYILNSKNNLEAASDYRSKKEGNGSKKKGSTGSLKINKRKPKLNTPTNNPRSGLNI
jgi:hypothetical protein